MPKQYRKKPVVIEAILWDGQQETAAAIQQWSERKVEFGNDILVIHTLEGEMKATIGDYIIKGVQGETYPCKPDIFQQTYEEA